MFLLDKLAAYVVYLSHQMKGVDTMINLLKNLKNNDGLTLKDSQPINYKSGWQVADYGYECKTAEEAAAAIQKMNGNCGVWLENGIYYVDHSFRVDTKKEAIAIGRKHNQISVFGWKRKNLAYC